MNHRKEPISYSNLSEALHVAGRHEEAVKRFVDALGAAEPANPWHAFVLARQAAAIGAEVESFELFARYLAMVTDRPLEDAPALEYIVAAPPEAKACLENAEQLRAAIERGLSFSHLAVPYTAPKADETGAGALEVFDDWAALRADATHAGLGDG